MSKISILGQNYSLVMGEVFGTSWFLRRIPSLCQSLPSKKARASLAVGAHNLRGTLGTTSYKGHKVPLISFKVAQTVPRGKAGENNRGVHGGKSKRERREQRWVSDAVIQAYVTEAQGVELGQQMTPIGAYGI